MLAYSIGVAIRYLGPEHAGVVFTISTYWYRATRLKSLMRQSKDKW